jgi:hypothetical protein
MRALLCALFLIVLFGSLGQSAEIQGVIADWNCTADMVRNGRSKTLQQRRSCSLMKDFNRSAYAVITDEKKFYRLDDNGNQQARLLLKNTPDKDNLKVVVTGDIQDGTIKVTNMSLL